MTTELTETQIQNQILDYLALRKVFAWRNNTRVVRLGGRLVKMGARGSPDIIGVLPGGMFLAIEVKKPGELPSTHQREFLSRLAQEGAVTLVASCVEDVQAELAWKLA